MQATEHLHDHHDHEHTHDHTQAWLKTALLVSLGLYFAYNIVSGNLTNYINIRFAWLSYLAAALFLLLGAASAYRLLRGSVHDTHHDHDHSHEEGLSWGMLAIISVPLVLGTLIPSRPLGAAAINADFNTNALASADNISTFTIDPLSRNVLDWIRVFSASDDLSSFNGQEADIVGFVYRDSTFGENQFLAARFTISCCVADSTAIGLPVTWDEDIPQDTWVRVYGRFQIEEFRGEQHPVLHPINVEVVDQPQQPYLYP